MTYRPEELTFVICAYKESQYLEECIQSVLHQTIPVNVIMSTSTPNEYIKNLCEKYKIELFINNKPSDIANDWNFAISKVSTKLVTIAHQDDVYKKNYAEMILQKINTSENPLIAFSDYSELRNGEEITENKLLNIKRKLLSVIKRHPKSIFFRRRSLSLGNAICCPAVSYVLENLPQPIFIKGMKSNIDWDAWERLSLLPGSFCYVDEVLMSHRIHSDSTTSEVIQETGRQAEDLAMLKKFWPNWIANIIEWKYKDSEKQNNL